MKTQTKWLLPIILGLAVGALVFAIGSAGDRDRMQRMGPGTEPLNIAGTAVGCAVAVTAAVLGVVFVLPWMWRGFLKGTRDISKAVRDKD